METTVGHLNIKYGSWHKLGLAHVDVQKTRRVSLQSEYHRSQGSINNMGKLNRT